MNNNLYHITGLINKSLRFLFLIIIINFSLSAQSISNLEKFYTLVDSASSLMLKDLGDIKEVKLDLNLGIDYSVFANQIRGKVLKNKIKLFNDGLPNGNVTNVNFVIDNCSVEYGSPERDGLFGDFYAERKIKLSGNYFISYISSLKKFALENKDTINVEDFEKIENRSYPFTQGELPSEPFFSSLLEPIVAISAAAITIILFFSVRSK